MRVVRGWLRWLTRGAGREQAINDACAALDRDPHCPVALVSRARSYVEVSFPPPALPLRPVLALSRSIDRSSVIFRSAERHHSSRRRGGRHGALEHCRGLDDDDEEEEEESVLWLGALAGAVR